MRFSGTDVMAVAVIATCGAAGLAFSVALTSDSASTSTYTWTTDFETAQNVVVGERVQRIRTDESGVHIEREVGSEREIGIERTTGATVIRIRGDADAVEPNADVRVEARHRVRIESTDDGREGLCCHRTVR